MRTSQVFADLSTIIPRNLPFLTLPFLIIFVQICRLVLTQLLKWRYQKTCSWCILTSIGKMINLYHVLSSNCPRQCLFLVNAELDIEIYIEIRYPRIETADLVLLERVMIWSFINQHDEITSTISLTTNLVGDNFSFWHLC